MQHENRDRPRYKPAISDSRNHPSYIQTTPKLQVSMYARALSFTINWPRTRSHRTSFLFRATCDGKRQPSTSTTFSKTGNKKRLAISHEYKNTAIQQNRQYPATALLRQGICATLPITRNRNQLVSVAHQCPYMEPLVRFRSQNPIKTAVSEIYGDGRNTIQWRTCECLWDNSDLIDPSSQSGEVR